MTALSPMDSPSPSSSSSKKSLLRSATWTARSSPPATKPSKPGRPVLPPLHPIPRLPLTAWPPPSSDDISHLPSTPSFSGDADLSPISDHLFLGSDAASRNLPALRRHAITHILNCVGSACPAHFPADFQYMTLYLHDSPAEDLSSVLYDAFDFLELARAAPHGRVLVHCLRGASRSAAVVIAYLMWLKCLSFDDALRLVRKARAVADPNLGFAAQLLQCQRRVHALPPSPGSAVRAYRMALHSPYDPLHLVPKSVDRPSPARLLDSRGAVLVHVVGSAIFVWLGAACEPPMARSAAAFAAQLVRYERAQGGIVTVNEGMEPPDFWTALVPNSPAAGDVGETGKKRVELFDLDFEIFKRALKGGVVPPFPMSGPVTRLPARESGWSLVRQRFLSGGVQELAAESSPKDEESSENFRSPGSLTPSSSSADSASTRSSFSPASSSSSDWFNSSPPGSKHCITPPPAPKLISRLPPLYPCKEKPKDSTTLQPLAERRGSVAPSLVILPTCDSEKCGPSSRYLVMDWCDSPAFASETKEQQLRAADVDMDAGVSKENTVDDHYGGLVQPILFHWPTMAKMEMIHPGALDSRSVFLLVAPNDKLHVNKQRVLYVWFGKESFQTSIEMGGEDVKGMDACFNNIAGKFLDQLGLPADIPVQKIREGEEPEQFLNHLLSFQRSKGTSCS